jgi:hypothetical protein
MSSGSSLDPGTHSANKLGMQIGFMRNWTLGEHDTWDGERFRNWLAGTAPPGTCVVAPPPQHAATLVTPQSPDL